MQPIRCQWDQHSTGSCKYNFCGSHKIVTDFRVTNITSDPDGKSDYNFFPNFELYNPPPPPPPNKHTHTPPPTNQRGSCCVQQTYPYVHFWSIVSFAFKQFWCSIRWTATPSLELFAFLEDVTKSKICSQKFHSIYERKYPQRWWWSRGLWQILCLHSANLMSNTACTGCL